VRLESQETKTDDIKPDEWLYKNEDIH
jgi:hypothetical protein